MKKGWLLKLINRPIVRGILKSVPFVGDVVDNITEGTFEAPEGVLDTNKLLYSTLRLAVLCVLLYLAFSGKIDFEQAEQAKDFIK